MTSRSLFLEAFGIGVAIAAPVGPMSLLCMRATLARGWRYGLATGAGIAVGDGTYATVAALGFTGLSSFLLAYQRPLHIAAGLFLLYFGLKILRADPANIEPAAAQAGRGWPRAMVTATALTLTNPPTIALFAAVFAALAPTNGFRPAEALATVGGVFSGSILWWCLIVAIVSSVRHAIGARARLWIDRASGLLLALLGVAAMYHGTAG